MKRIARIATAAIITALCLAAPAMAAQTTRVMAVQVEPGVLATYRGTLELVAFAPGAGWIRLNTRDGISPMLRLRGVGSAELDRFNRFAASIGLPLRVDLKGRTLHLSARGPVAFETLLASAPQFEPLPMLRPDPTTARMIRRPADGGAVQLALN